MKKKTKHKEDHADNKAKRLLDCFLVEHGVNEWDYVLFGDGSGSGWDREVGWSTICIDAITGERTVWYGGMSRGTVNFAEIMAYLQPLTYLQGVEEDRAKLLGRRVIHVHIFTDSEYCRNTGNSSKTMRHKNGCLWRIFDTLKADGFLLHWHWIRRETVDLHSYNDKLSKLSRLLFKNNNLIEQMIDDYDLQPAEIHP